MKAHNLPFGEKFERGGISRTLFIHRPKDKLLVVQIYVIDIV